MAQIVQRKRVFWGWEGTSERNYGGYLQLVANELNIPLHFDREHNLIGGGDPLAIVEQCIRVMQQSERRKGKYKYRAILIDTDRKAEAIQRFNKAIQLCQKHNIDLLLQDCNHEAMLVRHHRDHVRARPKRDSLRRLLKLWPQYEKPMSAQQLFVRFGCEPLDFLQHGEPDMSAFLAKIGLRHYAR